MRMWERKTAGRSDDRVPIGNKEDERSETRTVAVHLDRYAEFQDQLDLIGVTPEDWRLAPKIGKFIGANADKLVDYVYSRLGARSQLVNIIEQNSNLKKHMNILKHHLVDIFGGDIDDAYIERRIRIAQVHVKVGLEIRYYVAAMQVLLNGIEQAAVDAGFQADDRWAFARTASKLLNFEVQLVLHFYEWNIKQEKESIKKNMSELASGLASVSMQTSASMQEVVGRTGSVTSVSRQGTELANTVKQRVDDGLAGIQSLLHNLSLVRDGIHQVHQQVASLAGNTNKVQEITVWVKEIADQTQLLSLNASIEAARAGELGRGFEVVASEVKKLADQTRESVDSIKRLIESTVAEVGRIADSIEGMDKLAVGMQQQSNSVEGLFHHITESIDSNRDMNGQIEQDLTHLLQVLEEIGEANRSIAASSEKMDDLMKAI